MCTYIQNSLRKSLQSAEGCFNTPFVTYHRDHQYTHITFNNVVSYIKRILQTLYKMSQHVLICDAYVDLAKENIVKHRLRSYKGYLYDSPCEGDQVHICKGGIDSIVRIISLGLSYVCVCMCVCVCVCLCQISCCGLVFY